jgi:hypothetical protein
VEVGCVPYIEQRLDSGGVLGRLQMVSNEAQEYTVRIHTILGISSRRGGLDRSVGEAEGASQAADRLGILGPKLLFTFCLNSLPPFALSSVG